MSDPALVATVLADRAPARALGDHMALLALEETQAADTRAAALFESVFYRLPPYADERLPATAAAIFGRLGRGDAALLLDGLAAQMQAPRPLNAASAEAEAIVAAREQGALLLAALERRAREADWPGSALLFETVWPCLRPIGAFWVFQRMSNVYAALHRPDAVLVTAALAIQLEPADRVAHDPYAHLLRHFREHGRARDAAELVEHRRALCPDTPLLAEDDRAALRAAAGPRLVPPPRPAWRAHPVFPAETRAPRPWPTYGAGVPIGMRELLEPMARNPVVIAELAEAEVLAMDDTVAVFSADGALQTELSVGPVPSLLPRRLAERARADAPPRVVTLAAAVLLNDEFPAPNLCHFLFDHAPRLLLYRRAGIDLSGVSVIGPAPRTAYQREILARSGVQDWHATDAPTRFRVRRLYVSSDCRHLQHPAHWGARWAVESVRALFDLTPRAPARRLLVSRADSPYRRIANEDEVAALLAPLGFERIIPGRLGFAEQIAAFRDATHVIGPHGAGLANLMFCAPGAHVLEVLHPHYGTWAYAIAGAALDLDYRSLVARDAESDAPAFNDPDFPLPERNAHAGRDMRVDAAALRHWLGDIGAS